MKRILIAIAILSVISSCRKGLQEELIPMDLNVNDIETITVIDAKIEMDSTAWVQIPIRKILTLPLIQFLTMKPMPLWRLVMVLQQSY